MTKVINVLPGIGEAGNTIAYIRARNPAIDTEPEDQYNHFVALSSRCMHLGCPVRYVSAAERFICPCHGGVYDFRGMVAGGPPVRPLDRFYTRLNRKPASSRSAPAIRSTTSCAASRRGSRVSRSTASASTCIPPSSTPPGSPNPLDAEAPRPASAQGPPAAPEAAGRGRRAGALGPAEAGITVVDWLDERTALSPGIRWLHVAQGPARDQLGLHARLGHAVRLPQPGRDRRVPGHVLPPRRGQRRVRVDPQHQRQRVPRPVRARHAQVGRVGDDHPDLPAHGAGVLLRRLQVPPRADLGDRRRAADPHAGHGLHRLPAAVRSARLLGLRSSGSTSTPAGRSSGRSCRTSCSAARTSGPPPCRASTRSTCC